MNGIDLKLTKTAKGYYDISWKDGDFELTDSYETAILMSLLCERRADSSEVSIPENRRGWWGNLYLGFPGFEIGSKLWLLEQAKITIDTLNAAITYTQDCLQWMIDDKLADEIQVDPVFENSLLVVKVKIYRSSSIIHQGNYQLWQNTGGVISHV